MSNSSTVKNSNPKKKKPKVKVYTKKNNKNESESVLIEKLQAKYAEIVPANISKFTDFPLSQKTLKGLKGCKYTSPTEIQREAIGLALQGKDILGAAQTGSGKTLAFLIPVLEVLFCKQWTNLDGMGALVITPTRELAYQIFECLTKIGKYHDFSAGLIIGGQGLKFERKRIDQCNIMICTPGRLLQHMDENPLFDCANMQILVLDEADRCLDMGFQETMNAIIANLPPQRQTLLFSATQTKSVKDLARLSLKDPRYVSVHENSKYSTPQGLEQSYVVCELQDKISIIWSFIRNHLKHKCIIFFSSCKQVKYIYDIFCKLRPGMSILALYGTLHQQRRMTIYESFCQKSSAVLFATDLAARGLDFPRVNWVIQADCPEDTDTYIHRVGRTARYHQGGESLLMLLSNEQVIINQLEQRKIPITKIDINPNKLQNPVRKMEAFLARDPSLKESAQRAFKSYVKAVFLMKDKNIFNANALDTDSFAKSLGLAIPPRIRFLQKFNARNAQKQQTSQDHKYFDEETDDKLNKQENIIEKTEPSDTEVSEDEPLQKQESTANLFAVEDDSDSGDEILKIKRKDHDVELPSKKELEELQLSKILKTKPVSKVAAAKKLLRKKIAPNKKIVFDEEGEAVIHGTKEKRSELARQYENEDEAGIDIEKAKMILKEEDKFDKQLFKEKVKIKHKEKKMKLKQQQRGKRQEDEEEQDDFGTDSEEEPDLSWLPDPDKIYGKEEDGGSESEGYIKSEDEDSEATKPNSLKRTTDMSHEQQPPIKKGKRADTSSLTVNEAEELAMMFLKK